MVENEIKETHYVEVTTQTPEAELPQGPGPASEQPDFFIIRKEGMDELQALIGHIENAGKTGLLDSNKALERMIGTLQAIILRPGVKKE